MMHRMLSDRDLARGIAGLSREQFSVTYPESNPGVGRNMSYQVPVPLVTVGGIRAAEVANDIKAILEEVESLRAQLSERLEGPKVRVDGGKVVLGRDGVATITGDTVTITGPARFAEVRS